MDLHGSYSWSGRYDDKPIVDVLPFDSGHNCILLLDRDSYKQNVIENLFCIDQNGEKVWIAKLPNGPDVFVAIRLASGGILANTYNGLSILIDIRTGRELKKSFVK